MEIIIQPIPNKRIENLIGKQSGKLTIIGFSGIETRGKNTVATWAAKCLCGNIIKVVSGQFNRGHHVSCGCKKVEQLQNTKIDLTNQKFSRLTVIRQATHKKGQSVKWECLCDCGNSTIVDGNSLRRGLTISCGCYHKEVSRKVIKRVLEDYRVAHGFNPHEPMSTKMQLLRTSWKSVIKATKKRDNFTCQLCGMKQRLHSHHIIPVSTNILLGDEPTNIITLCENCHIKKAHTDSKNISKKYQLILQEKIKQIYSVI